MEDKHMKLETLRDLLIEQLQDIYDAEHQITKALPKMVKAAHSRQLKDGFNTHLDETKQHITRLEQVFQMLDQQPKRKHCHGMEGLLKEGDEMIKEDADADVKDAGLITAAQRVEHYEIAGYGTAMAYAKQIGQTQMINLLKQTLDEEKATDEKLSQLAESNINVRASQ
jgi:ferritin-like metal-binding protein YciE